MKRVILFTVFAFSTLLFSCDKKDTAASVATKWCDLNSKVTKAATEEEKTKAQANLKAYETEMEAKYKGNETFMKEVEVEVNKCEAASEGR